MFEEFDDDLLDLSLEAPRATVEDVDDENDENKVTVSKVRISKLLYRGMFKNIILTCS